MNGNQKTMVAADDFMKVAILIRELVAPVIGKKDSRFSLRRIWNLTR
ncbi:MAG: hypothetical protein GX488_11645 [Clostridiales bacterium]|nr:hypothetical protein [Clostridiales bacterium]